MSIVWSLTKLFDPATHNYEEGERHSERELPEDEDDGDPPTFEMAPGAATAGKSAPERYQCRICGHTASHGPYCPECLADTMKPVP
jgi:rubrerythrin